MRDDDAADAIARLLAQVVRRFQVSRHALPGADVTPRMLGVLQHLLAAGPLTLGELAAHLGASKAATTELAGRLAAKGLLARMPDERDRRRVFLWLSDAGRAQALALPHVTEDAALSRAVERLRPADRDQLLQGLRALIAASAKETT